MIQFKKVAFHTFGCKLNFSETSTISRLFEDSGIAKVALEEQPDIFIVNTCSVTENADKRCKQLVRKVKRLNPECFVVIVGCFAQLKPNEIAKMDGVDMVLGANEKFNILTHLDKIDHKSPEQAHISFDSIKKTKDFIPSFSLGDRTRSFLKIQDGCDYFCTFCTIPLARGKSRNASIKNTISEATKIAETSVKEVVLTGVNIGDFGQGEKENFYSLIKELDKIKGIDRFRISSIEPNLLTDEIIHFCLKDAKKITPHFHIPLQSGNDQMLKAMRRKYDTKLYENRINLIKSLRPDACIGVDVIVGFPGETDEYFNDTLNFLKKLDVSYLHVFTYSERANTTAKKMTDVVPMSKRKERSQVLHLLSDRKKRAFYAKNENTVRKVLIENENNNGMMYGFTENYVKIKIPYQENLANTIQTVSLTKLDRDIIFKSELITMSKQNLN
ncbi:tRNA (N(6)-L-threonylcarbamoyladenosine(37)-C(2))-methylthiotransferase MtaB [Crocinitomicaceae bacterium]|nr:tRNA (N(6)-L-threonylcarbamoyladenosine(37)-C(2))-methylthiotransferase MtaB [Crocinitomicaceae bacterium]MDC0297205.1 tRNA (N(6)-L-threonylcarbamoyladenosine(37)-C(2))-methylthiotransferase MtaB [Crocinitomicaceae bacterium]